MKEKGGFMQKIQRFGGAMFTPVLFFAIFGIIVGFATLFKNSLVFGELANPDGNWYKIWDVIYNGANTVFKQMPLLFAIGLPVSLAKKQQARACLETFVIYAIFLYCTSTILQYWGPLFGVDFQSTARTSGLASVAGIRTLDMGMVGALIISGISVYLHNHFFDTEVSKYVETFKGSPFVVLLGFLVMLPVSVLACLVWPHIQNGIAGLQQFLASTGVLGIGLYTSLERFLIPFGLHHFIYAPFLYDAAVVDGGIKAFWVAHLSEYAASSGSLVELFPAGGFALTGMSKMFAPLGVCAAFYATAKPEKRKKVLAILVPVLITAVFTGITEPLEFTFLFVAPILYVCHSILAGLMSAITFACGISGDFSLGLIQNAALNWVPMWASHGAAYLLQIVIGLCFSAIYFVLFRFLILKMNLKTPGREDEGEESKLYTKQEYRERKAKGVSKYAIAAEAFLEGLGGKDNIVDVTNCATRLRVSVKDAAKVKDTAYFNSNGAHGLVKNGTALQIIVGLTVPSVREEFEKLL
ncbi:MAG: alpha-glucoside-specific PTS transporter subunit IIBC [Eubacteriales bacterium]|nr:alpha-glucoside-specific PTS transporter subunit IIBC [Eubacteriales bacterium]